MKLTHKVLKEILSYNRRTGIFTWNKTRPGIRIGSAAGSVHHDGYVYIGFEGKSYLAHRLAWFYVLGIWPWHEIDHKDHNRQNNSIYNLRDVTTTGNGQNQIKAKSHNKSGFLGVHLHKHSGKFHSEIIVDGKKKSLKYFDTPEEAHKAYVEAKRKYHNTCTI